MFWNIQQPGNKQLFILVTVINDLIRTGNFSLRELLKIKKLNYILMGSPSFGGNQNPIQNSKEDSINFPYLDYHFFRQIHFFTLVSNIDVVIEKFTNCRNKITEANNVYIKENDIDYTALLLLGIVSLNSTGSKIDEMIHYNMGEKQISFFMEEFYDKPFRFSYKQDSVKILPENTKISAKDFYDVLIDVAIKFKKVGGLNGQSFLK